MTCRKILVICVMSFVLCRLWTLNTLADDAEVYVVDKNVGDGGALKVKFDRTAIEEAVAGASDEVTIHIVGSVNQKGYTTDFSGADTIRIMRSGKTK